MNDDSLIFEKMDAKIKKLLTSFTLTKYLAITTYMKYKRKQKTKQTNKKHFAELLIFYGDYNQWDWINNLQRKQQKADIHRIQSEFFLFP